MLAQAAALCAKAARLSERQLTVARAAALTQEAERIRAEAASLIDRDALAYRAVLAASRRPGRPAPTPPASPAARTATPAGRPAGEARPTALAAALSDAADVPLRIVELAVAAAELAAALAADCKPALRGDAIAAGELAQAAARAAAALVTINLDAAPDDPRHARVIAMVASIAGRLPGAAGGLARPGGLNG